MLSSSSFGHLCQISEIMAEYIPVSLLPESSKVQNVYKDSDNLERQIPQGVANDTANPPLKVGPDVETLKSPYLPAVNATVKDPEADFPFRMGVMVLMDLSRNQVSGGRQNTHR
ncbi:hypothetical protein AXG93_3986s1250 [Marchantia polymorpha subsp. ruderalis]|uniref:Uncharacterized protein n=1 Tax=Marchantia polymorpha subsp. ruderalis TaxID=1480154 RepID=A0A176VQF5_MARPO|nr:hypothetical protein AXG93_3986s1250 [Marchantia polymorpha subsp. ruderalis]